MVVGWMVLALGVFSRRQEQRWLGGYSEPSLRIVEHLPHDRPGALAREWNLHGIGAAQPLLVAGFGGELLQVGFVIGSRVVVVAEQLVPIVFKFMDEDGGVAHVVFFEQIADALMGGRVKSFIAADSIGAHADHHFL
jgi:hypothetical protein